MLRPDADTPCWSRPHEAKTGLLRSACEPAAGRQLAGTDAQKIASVQYLVGTWNCHHTVGTFSGTYTTTYTRVLGDQWLKQTYDFPATQAPEASPAVQAEFLMEYDDRAQAWVRFGALSNGDYFAIRIRDAPDGSWRYKYVSFFKRTTPETPEDDAVFSRKGDSEYTVDGPSYQKNGVRVTEHHTCKKA